MFSQLASVDVELDPKPERDAECEMNPVNAPINSPRATQVKNAGAFKGDSLSIC